MDPVSEKLHIDDLILRALREDIPGEDISTNAVMPCRRPGQADLICKGEGVIAGLSVFARVFRLLDPETEADFTCRDGDRVGKGQRLGTVRGDIRILLSGERTALNFLQRMSGIATCTAAAVSILQGSCTRLLDTRKTTPGLRLLEKYAVRMGGGHNHRFNLSDGILLKDNHIAAAGGVAEAIRLAREYAPHVHRIEIEVESLPMLKEALEAGADIIMLDNMSPDEIRQAVAVTAGRAELECSGNITVESLASLAAVGVDYISSGALTHSAHILDLSLKNLRPL